VPKKIKSWFLRGEELFEKSLRKALKTLAWEPSSWLPEALEAHLSSGAAMQ
jgi:hypothetical protein